MRNQRLGHLASYDHIQESDLDLNIPGSAVADLVAVIQCGPLASTDAAKSALVEIKSLLESRIPPAPSEMAFWVADIKRDLGEQMSRLHAEQTEQMRATTDDQLADLRAIQGKLEEFLSQSKSSGSSYKDVISVRSPQLFLDPSEIMERICRPAGGGRAGSYKSSMHLTPDLTLDGDPGLAVCPEEAFWKRFDLDNGAIYTQHTCLERKTQNRQFVECVSCMACSRMRYPRFFTNWDGSDVGRYESAYKFCHFFRGFIWFPFGQAIAFVILAFIWLIRLVHHDLVPFSPWWIPIALGALAPGTISLVFSVFVRCRTGTTGSGLHLCVNLISQLPLMLLSAAPWVILSSYDRGSPQAGSMAGGYCNFGAPTRTECESNFIYRCCGTFYGRHDADAITSMSRTWGPEYSGFPGSAGCMKFPESVQQFCSSFGLCSAYCGFHAVGVNDTVKLLALEQDDADSLGLREPALRYAFFCCPHNLSAFQHTPLLFCLQ